MDITKIAFDSRLNYLKKGSDTSGTTSITLGGSGATTTHTVTHNLGYIPFFIVGAELPSTGTIWSNNYVHEFTQSSGTPPNTPVQLDFWCTSTTLTIEIRNGTGTGQQSGSRQIYWNIYLDYEN
jgi:hypothetical protein